MAEDSEIIFKWNHHLSDIASKLHYMLARETLVDTTLISAEGKSIKVHRLMLCASSKLFEDKFIQHPSAGPVTINLKDIRMEDLQSVIEFIYKGEISVALAQVPSLLKAASSLKIIVSAFDLYQNIQSLATTAAESSDVTNNTAMDYDAEIQPNERQDRPMNTEKEERYKTGEAGINNEELMDQSDDGESQCDDPNEYLSQHSSLDGADLSNDSSDEVLVQGSTAGPYSRPIGNANTEPSSKVHSQPKKTGLDLSNSKRQTNGPEKTFKCGKCWRAYSRKKNLHRHILHECDNEPRFRCSQCDYRTHWKHSLQAHLIGFHKVDRSQLSAFGAGSSKVRLPFTKPFKCDKCYRAFRYKHNLKFHLMNECKIAQDAGPLI